MRITASRWAQETGKPIAQVAKDPVINETTLSGWVSQAHRASGAGVVGENEELARLLRESALAAPRCGHTEACGPGQLRWGRLTHGARGAGNPCYAGMYVCGRYTIRRTVGMDSTVRIAMRLQPRDLWPVVLHDHHRGYITWADFLEIEAKLKANCTHHGACPAARDWPCGIIGCGSSGSR